MPAGLLVIVPFPDTPTVNCPVPTGMKVAEIDSLPATTSWHEVPVQAPPKSENL
jgi:hypothetical protein